MTNNQPTYQAGPNQPGNFFSSPAVANFLNQFQGTVHAMPKPLYQDTPPVWKQQLILGLETQNDIRRFTQIRCWIKPPSERFAQANTFLSLVNAKGSVFVRLNSVDELKALSAALTIWIPEIEAKLAELAPLEAQYALAKQAFDIALNSSNHNEHNEDEE